MDIQFIDITVLGSIYFLNSLTFVNYRKPMSAYCFIC